MPRRKAIRSLDELLQAAQSLQRTRRVVLVGAEDPAALSAVVDAHRAHLVDPVLVGDADEIARRLKASEADDDAFPVVDIPDPRQAVRHGLRMCRDGESDMLMKGAVPTSMLLRAALSHDEGISTGRTISQVSVFRPVGANRLMFFSDPAANILPDLGRKIEILRNAVGVAQQLGVRRPRVAVLAAVEKINPDMPATTDAAILTQMGAVGDLGDCLVQGPLSLDCAVSPEAAKCKGVTGPVAGQADVLIAPNIEAANILYKSLVYFCRADIAGAVVGASKPIMMSSRSDDRRSKLLTIALATLLSP